MREIATETNISDSSQFYEVQFTEQIDFLNFLPFSMFVNNSKNNLPEFVYEL
jgi:hypothetical protein